MIILTETRIEQVVQQAQLSLYVHERDGSYPEILELVDEMVDLLMEVRRDHTALQEIAALWPEARAAALRHEAGAQLALRMCVSARNALGMRATKGELELNEEVPLPAIH
jgi:hypothetical protein